MHAEIIILTGDNFVLNADDGLGVVGSMVYEVGLTARQPFSIFVDLIGRDP